MKIMNTKRRLAGVLGVLVALCLVCSLGTPVLAVPEMNHTFYGDVTSGDEPLPQEIIDEGVSVEAWINDELCASTTVGLDSRYGWETEFEVSAEVASAGDPIEFYVNGVQAALYDVDAGVWLESESYPFEIGGYTELKLEADIIPPSAPDAALMTVNMNAPGTADTIEGDALAVEGDSTIEVWDSSDPSTANLIDLAIASADGSFPAIEIGDNAYAAVWITAKDAEDNRSDAIEMANDIEGPAFVSVAVTDSDEFYKAGDTVSFDVDLGETGLTAIADLTVLDSALASDFALADDDDGTYSGTTSALSSETMVEGVDTAVTLTATDAVGNPTTDDSLTLTIDKTPPVISATSPATDADIKAGFTLDYTLDEAVASGTIAFTATEPAGTTQTYTLVSGNFASGAHTIAEADLTGVTLVNGTVYSIDFDATDPAGNPASTVTNTGITYDTGAPTVTIDSSATSPTSTSPIPMTATFSEDVTGFELDDIDVTNGTADNFAGSGADYTFDVTATGEVMVTVNIAAGAATDAATNGNEAAPEFTINFDDVAPTVAIESTASDPTNTSPIPVTATFSEDVTGFELADIIVGNGTADNFVEESGAVYNFDVTPADQGAVTVDIATGVAEDAATNPNEAAIQFSITYDSLAPTVTIDSVTTPTNIDTLTLTGTMEEGATVALTSAEATFGEVSYPTATTWTADVTLDEESNVIAATATDATGNTATAEVTIVLDTAAPTAILLPEDGDIDVAIDAVVSATFDEDVTLVDLSGITIDGATGVSATLDEATDTITIAHDDFASLTSYTVTIPAGAVEDLAGNPNTLYTWSFNSVTIAFTITATAGDNGSISPSGVVPVNYGGSEVFTITPDTGYYEIEDVLVDGVSVLGDLVDNTYTFENVVANHTISATFALVGPEVPVSINAPGEVAEDSDFTATVDIGEVVDLNAAEYDVSFDNTVLRLDDITSGQIDGTSIPVAFNEIIPGTYKVVQTMLLDTVSGSGSLAVLHFHVIGSTGESSAIDLSNGILSGFEGEIPATWTGDLVDIGIDETPPSVVTKSPEADATNVPLDVVVSATFHEAIDEATLVFTLDSVAGTPSYDSSTKTATFIPDANLAYETTYTASIQASDLVGNPMAEAHTWSFTTVAQDTTPPTVVSTSPEADATGMAVDTVVTATFSEAMDESTITADSFTLVTESTAVSGSVSYDSVTLTATFTPSDNLTLDTTYTANLSTAITDAAGNPLDEAYSWTFTTAMESLGDLIDEIDPGGTLELEARTYSGDVTIDKPMTITGTEGTIISGGIHIAPLTGSEFTIENVTITDYTDYGIWIELVYADDVFNIRNNTILGVEGSVIGIKVEEVEADGILNIEQNTISGNEVGIELLRRVAAGAIEFNNIIDNDVGLKLLVVGEHMIGASMNWWGDISGPEHEVAFGIDPANPGGIGDKIELADGLSYYPWLTREFQTVLDDNIAYFGYPMVWLYTGWNIMSTPVALDPACDTWGEYVDLGDGLAIHATSPAWRFDGQTQGWIGLTNDSPLEPCDAIYVRMASDDIAAILYSPDRSVPSKELYSGWNLVSLAWVDGSAMPVDEALVTVEEVTGDLTGYKLVVSLGMSTWENSWIYIAGNDIDPWTDPNDWPPPDGWMIQTSGYWVFMLNDGTLAGFTFTPISLW